MIWLVAIVVLALVGMAAVLAWSSVRTAQVNIELTSKLAAKNAMDDATLVLQRKAADAAAAAQPERPAELERTEHRRPLVGRAYAADGTDGTPWDLDGDCPPGVDPGLWDAMQSQRAAGIAPRFVPEA